MRMRMMMMMMMMMMMRMRMMMMMIMMKMMMMIMMVMVMMDADCHKDEGGRQMLLPTKDDEGSWVDWKKQKRTAKREYSRKKEE